MYSQKTAPNLPVQAEGSQLKGALCLTECMNWWRCSCATFNQAVPEQIAAEMSVAVTQKHPAFLLRSGLTSVKVPCDKKRQNSCRVFRYDTKWITRD